MGSPQKRQRVQQTEDDQIDYISSLKVDCLHAIFDQLSEDDVCSIGLTCKAIRNVAGAYFRLKYPEKLSQPVEIEEDVNGEFIFGDFNGHSTWARSFSYLVENVRIKELDMESNDRLSLFMQKCFDGNLKRIEFLWAALTPTFGSSVKSVLANVEIIHFEYYEGALVCRENFLSNCPNLKELKVTGAKEKISIPCIKLPSLETIRFEYRFDQETVSEFAEFLRLNPNINTIVCSFQAFFTDDSIDEDVKGFLSTIKGHANIEALSLDFHDYWYKSRTVKLVEAVNEMKQLKWLRLKFFGHTMYICYPNMQEAFIKALPRTMPNIEELYLACDQFEAVIFATIVRTLPRLNKLTIFRNSNTTDDFEIDVRLLNEQRKQMRRARKMTIFHNLGDSIKLVNNDDGLVIFKEIETKHDLNAENPLIDFIVKEL